MTFACNMFILAGLAGAAGVLLLPVPGAIVSPVFIPRSCQVGSQTAEGMVRPRWESGAGEAAHVPACLGKREPPGHHPVGCCQACPGQWWDPPAVTAGSDPGVLRAC